MLRSLISTILLPVLLLFSFTSSANSSTLKTILVVGDSISAAHGLQVSQGWVSMLATKITQEKIPYQVINASIGGDTTRNGLVRLKPLLQKYSPAVVIIELGGNDGLRGLSIKQMKNNLRSMTRLSQKAGAKVILAGMRIPPNYGKRYTDAFYNVYKELSQQFSTGLIPFLLEGVGDHPELMQDDGIHPKANAQGIILQTVWNELEKFF